MTAPFYIDFFHVREDVNRMKTNRTLQRSK